MTTSQKCPHATTTKNAEVFQENYKGNYRPINFIKCAQRQNQASNLNDGLLKILSVNHRVKYSPGKTFLKTFYINLYHRVILGSTKNIYYLKTVAHWY